LIFFIVFVKSAYSEDSAEKMLFQLDEISVSSTLMKQQESIPNMTVIIPELLLQGIGSTLDSALLRQTGIDVRRTQEVGGALDDESIRIRGFGSNRIQLTIDGRLINNSGTAGGYYIDWSSIPLNNIDRIEVIKGVSDARYGNVLGGVINLVTKKPTKKATIEAQALVGEFGTWTVSFYHSYKPDKFEYSLSGGSTYSDGYLWNGNFSERNINFYVGYDLPWDAKIKGDLQFIEVKKGFIVNNRLSKDPSSLDYQRPKNPDYPVSDGEIMYGGMGAYAEPGSWWKRQKVYFNTNYEQKILDGLLSLRYWQNYGDREAYNTRLSVNRVFHKKFYDDRSYGLDGNYTLYLNNHTVELGIDFKKFRDKGDKNYPDDYRNPFSNDNYVSSKIVGIYLLDDIKISNNFILTPSLRFMSYKGIAGDGGVKEGIKDISMSGLAPALKLTYLVNPKSLIYASLARALRMPTPPEYYWHYSPDAGVDTSNLPFNKEDGLMAQGGFKMDLNSKTRLEIGMFYYHIKDYINFDLINFVSYNIDKAKIYGIEIELAQQLGKGFSIFGNYTLQKSKTSGDPFVRQFVAEQDRGFSKITSMPEHKFNIGLQFKGNKREKITLYGRYVSNQDVIYNNNLLFNNELRVKTQSSFFTVDIEASYPVLKNVDITAYCKNLFNKNYQERYGYPSQERNLGIGIRSIL